MNKKAQIGAKMVISLVVVVIIGVISLSVITELISPQVEPQSTVNEAVTTSNATAVQLANDNLLSNATCAATPYLTNLTAGTILWDDTHPSNASQCNYTYYADNYITNGTTVTVMNILELLFAVLVLVIIAFFAVKVRV